MPLGGPARSTLQISTNDLLRSIFALQGTVPTVNFGNHYFTNPGTTSLYDTFPFGFTSQSLMMLVTSGSLSPVTFSYDGDITHGSVGAGDTVTFDGKHVSSISFKCASNADPAIKLIVW